MLTGDPLCIIIPLRWQDGASSACFPDQSFELRLDILLPVPLAVYWQDEIEK